MSDVKTTIENMATMTGIQFYAGSHLSNILGMYESKHISKIELISKIHKCRNAHLRSGDDNKTVVSVCDQLLVSIK